MSDKITVTFDPAKYKLVPLETGIRQMMAVLEWNRSREPLIKIGQEYFVADETYKLMVKYVPPISELADVEVAE